MLMAGRYKRIKMLNCRKINICPGIKRQKECIIRRENVEKFYLSEEIINAAIQQKNKILDEAHAEAEAIRLDVRHRVSRQFWQDAQVLLDDWQREREKMKEDILQCTKQLLAQALQLAFAKQPTEKRTEALIQHLRRNYDEKSPASLLVNPQLRIQVENVLKMHSNNHWEIIDDSRLQKDQLCLKSTTGDFFISWETVKEQLLSAVTENTDATLT
ncbi:hypothetical protein EHW64_10205 [Erwinia psidii]|nr:hypothetical protein [Erwinia psidii]